MQKFIQKINTHITEKLNCVRIYLWVKPLSENCTDLRLNNQSTEAKKYVNYDNPYQYKAPLS